MFPRFRWPCPSLALLSGATFRCRVWPHFALASIGLLLGVSLPAVPASSATPAIAGPVLEAQHNYEKQVLPVLQKFCYDCHGDGMDKGNVALDKHADFTASFNDKKFWDNVREHVDTHVMPPEKKPQPSNEERAVIVKWIEDQVFWVDPAKPDPGHITLR